MFTITADGATIYDPRLIHEGLAVLQPRLSLGLNKSGSLTFSIPLTNPFYDKLDKLTTQIRVLQDDKTLFRGRILYDEKDFQKRKKIYAEGDLAFLLDSQQRPYSYTGDVAGLFQQFINSHNATVEDFKKFKMGIVDGVGVETASINTDYVTTTDQITNEILNYYGGYLRTREESDGVYIDYLSNYNTISNQIIQFGRNLMDLNEHVTAEDIFTIIVPVGADITDSEGAVISKVNISSVNDGKDYLMDEASVKIFGRIERSVRWTDVTDPNVLKQYGQEYLKTGLEEAVTLTINAIDLSMLEVEFDTIHVGDMVRVLSIPHNLDRYFQCTAIEYDLADPRNTTYTFGASYKTLTERSANVISKVTSEENNSSILEAAKNASSEIVTRSLQNYVQVTQFISTADVETSWRALVGDE